MIAALYVETNGVYYGLPDVDPWDEQRDARLYAGPWPVVAHPPCASWSIMGNCRPETRARGDGGTFAAAYRAVDTFGGVLEHPANSQAWKAYRLPRPTPLGWTAGLFVDGWTCEVDQRRYGHEARKPTWLYFVGDTPPPMLWGKGEPGERTIGRAWGGDREHLRARTPLAFRDVLLDMARSVPAARSFEQVTG